MRRHWLAQAHQDLLVAEERLAREVQLAREDGYTWAEIGKHLGKSRQYVHRKYATD